MSKSTRSLVVKLLLGFNLALATTFISGISNRHVSAAVNSSGNQEDSRIYHRIIKRVAPNASQKSIGNVIQQVSEQLLGAEYQTGLLDRTTHETLVISLQQFDCLLFIETVLAIAQNISQPDPSYQAFTQKVENQRYWNGKMNGYCSRLHYFSDWIADNQKRGNIKNITRQLGGIDTVKKLDFMTTHRSSYPNLAKSDLNFECVARVEASLTPVFNYIPTENISETYSQLQPGDIVGVATKISGLDFTHTGFVYQQPNGNMGLIHASPAGKVVIAQDLQKYISNVNQAIGIVVSRASEAELP
ncbi:MAG: N-acetylmuramoyl-L-alanine amidase-like domain-containing protein [Cyanobacteria bacterium J06621_12]